MIYHIEEMDKIREIEAEVKKKTGKRVYDISHWDSGENYKNYLNQYIDFPIVKDVFDYYYSYNIDPRIHNEVRKKININIEDTFSLFLPSSTLSIVSIANFLSKKIKKICILQPSYFSVAPCLQSFGLTVFSEELIYKDGMFIIPIDKILKNNYDAIWVTSPVFCTSISFTKTEISKLETLLKSQKYVICDESLSIYDSNISSLLLNNEYLLSIHCPHKVLGTNTIKFSCIVANRIHQDFFNVWSDVFVGGLSFSTKMAILHFLSDNYNFALRKGLDFINENYEIVKELLFQHNEFCSYTKAMGNYVTIIMNKIPYNISKEHNFIKLLIENTNVSLLPGYLEGFCQNFGFCFRINLTLDRTPLINSLNQVLLYLENTYLENA